MTALPVIFSLAGILLCGLTFLSRWRKNAFQALFLALLLFAVPLILSEMGLPVIKWFSIWPLYSWTGLF